MVAIAPITRFVSLFGHANCASQQSKPRWIYASDEEGSGLDEEDSGLAIGVNTTLLEWQVLTETHSDTNPAEVLPSFSLII